MNEFLRNQHETAPKPAGERERSPEQQVLRDLEEAETLVTDTESTIQSILDELDSLPPDILAEQQGEVLRLVKKLQGYKQRLNDAENTHEGLYNLYHQELKTTDLDIEKARAKGDVAEEMALLADRVKLVTRVRNLAGVTTSEEENITKVEEKIASYERKQPEEVNLTPTNPDAQQTRLMESESEDPEEKWLMDEMVRLGMERNNAGDDKTLADSFEKQRLALKQQLTELWEKEEEGEVPVVIKEAA